ncbi:DMT family transporter [Salidesulfovibrio onnuriiensis]|uniref:DMT family transporter n=1 Tax=Salidesulfovibrio onnuriiensis TaxID=2583823 RepID=UPI0011CC8C89|nr:DMT family transporter [Salidesulfovibrio onnuriiensis]
MFKACLNLSLAMVIVGSSVVAGKIMVEQLPVFLASMLRFVLALALLLPILFWREGGLPVLSRRSWAVLCLQALCGSFLFTTFLLYGLELTSPASAGIITSTTPACMGILGWVFWRERPSLRALSGILFSVAGVMVLNMVGEGELAGSSLSGNLLVLAAVVAESLFLLFRKWVPEPMSPLAAATVVSLFGLLWFLPAGLYELAVTDFSGVGAAGWWAVVYYGVFVTVLAYLFWFAGIVPVPTPVAGVFTGIMPLSAVILSALVLHERLQWTHYIGCACVLSGIALISGLRVRTAGRRECVVEGRGE